MDKSKCCGAGKEKDCLGLDIWICSNCQNEFEPEDNVTFTGKEAVNISLDDLIGSIDALNKISRRDDDLDHIVFNCDKDEFFKKLNIEHKESINSMSGLYGVRVYKRAYVPLNEVWLCDERGMIIKKFSI